MPLTKPQLGQPIPRKPGPKPPLVEKPLPLDRSGCASADFAAFCERYIRLSGNTPLILTDYWRDLMSSVLDAEPRPRFAAFALSRGMAKSTVAAAYCTYVFMLGGEDVSVDCVAVDERQARIVFGTAMRFIERHPMLKSRVDIFKDRAVIPWLGNEFVCLPASAAALEGRNADVTCVDEGGRVDPEVYEVVSLAAGKKPQSLVLVIGTPGPSPDNVLARFRQHAQDHPEDTSQVYREISAAAWPDHPTTCDDHDGGPGCISIANPSIAAGVLHRDGLMACQPPKMTENHFRRTRLVQWVTGTSDPAIPAELWASLSTGQPILDDSNVVLAFDGSYSGTDATVLVAATIGKRPHIAVLNLWTRPPGAGDDWRIPVLEVEEAVRQACKRYRVKEIACDTYRWQRSLEVLQAEGFPVVEFPQSISRMAGATSEFLQGCHDGQLTHSGDPILAQHVGNAVLSEEGRGGRFVKASRSRHAGRIDCLIAAVMAHSRASWYGNNPPKRRRVLTR